MMTGFDVFDIDAERLCRCVHRHCVAVVATPARRSLREPITGHHASGDQCIQRSLHQLNRNAGRPEVDMNVDALQLVRRTQLAKLTDLNRLVAAHFLPTWRDAREVDGPTRTVDRMLFDERTLTSNDVATSSLVLVDRQCYPEARADDPEAAGPPPKYAHKRKPTHISVDRLSNRDNEPQVALAHEPQPAGFIAATYPRHRHQHVLRVPVRFEFTDLHHRCAPSAATYCCPAERLLPTVAQHRHPARPAAAFRDSRPDAQRTRRPPEDRSCGPVADHRVP